MREPEKILNDVRSNIVKALNPDGSADAKDGMDAVLCAFDLKNKILHAACANNPIWYIQNGKLNKILPDKIPVGSHTNMSQSFTKHTIRLQAGDSVYLFTDGYADQFGGPKNKKFRYKQLEETLLANVHLPMKEQKDVLDKTFENWKGNYDQVDDVLAIGIRI
jgi:serine phosphatase RsbU (regulator of sigma subunit)